MCSRCSQFNDGRRRRGRWSGKIEITEKLSRRIYKLNSIPILNTGDEAGTYEVAVTFMADQKESRPEEDWFIFEPKTFELNPGESKSVAVTLTLPMNTKPERISLFGSAPDS